jgi:tRNA(fMet)-specific endonuclease VapC
VAFLLDTNVAIHLRDGDLIVTQKVAALEDAVLISVCHSRRARGRRPDREAAHAPIRRARLDAMLSAIPALAFDDLAAETYGDFVASAGYSRRKLLDRMIAVKLWCTGDLGHLQPGRLLRRPWSFTAGVAIEIAEEVQCRDKTSRAVALGPPNDASCCAQASPAR